MNIVVLGGDGFCGWPTSLRMSALGYNVTIIDNLSRRDIDTELGTSSLTPISSIEERLSCWKHITGRHIGLIKMDIGTDFAGLVKSLSDLTPDVVIHFAEQRAAPYSMKSSITKNYTVRNNICGTHNVLNAIVESRTNVHLVHLGTMGVYGYSSDGIQIPEGYLKIRVGPPGQEIEREILYPSNPGSIYHLTKCMDQQLFAYYAKNDKLRITDLHQGIVWGTQTAETMKHEGLVNRFDYDGDFGTVLNRFIVQSQVGHPLTVNGSGGQTRAFININDTINCIHLAINNSPPSNGQVRILNQMTETHRVKDLALLISERTNARIEYLPNPRNEAPENDLLVSNDTFLSFGLKAIKLKDSLIGEIEATALRYRDRIDLTRIPSTSTWCKW